MDGLMDNIIQPIFGEVDIRLLIGIAIGLAILIVISLIKRAGKLALVVAALCVIVVMCIPSVQSFQDKYSFEVSDGVAIVSINGQRIELDREYIESIKFVNNGDGNWNAQFISEEGTSTFDVPQFMYSSITKFANRYNIPIEVRE